MLKIEIHESTPDNMLRAIRAACNELLGDTTADLTTQAAQHNSRANELHAAAESETDKAAVCLTAHNAERQVAANPALAASYGQGGRVDAGQFYRVGEQPSEQTVLAAAFDKAVEATAAPAVAQALVDTPDLDSSGAEWNPELHASTKAKNQDGTWKKRRGAGKADEPQVENIGHAGQVAPPALPPLPPTPPSTLVTMNDIYALMTNGKAVLNDVIAAAQAMGFADVGAFSRDATPEQRAQLLAQLAKEVA